MNASEHGRVHSRDPSEPKVEITGGRVERSAEVLTPLALQLLASLHRRFNPRRLELLAARAAAPGRLDAGELPDFLPETAAVRAGDWRIAPVPAGPAGPPRRDHRPGRAQDDHQRAELRCEGVHGRLRGLQLRRPGRTSSAARSTCATRSAAPSASSDPATASTTGSTERTATLIVRPRGWHLPEKHVRVDGEPVSGVAVRLRRCSSANNHEALASDGTGPYFYLPKMESHLEARLWNEVFVAAQEALGMPRGTIKATVLIETILAAFEMDEILYELREHSAGLNCGRWDYIFSFIKKFRNRADFVLPGPRLGHDGQALPEVLRRPADQDLPPPRRARDGRHGRADPDPRRPGGQRGGDGAACAPTSCARPTPATTAPGSRTRGWRRSRWRSSTRCSCRRRTSSEVRREDVHVTAADLLQLPAGTDHRGGLRACIRVGVQYLEAWLRGNGCVPLYQPDGGCRHGGDLPRAAVAVAAPRGAVRDDGQVVTVERFDRLMIAELDRIHRRCGAARLDARGVPERGAPLRADDQE